MLSWKSFDRSLEVQSVAKNRWWFFLFIVNQYHILLNGFFFFAFRLPFAPAPYLVYLLAGKKNCCQVLFCMITMKTFGFYLFEPTFRAIRAAVNWSNTIEILCSKSFSLSFSMLASKLDYSSEKTLQNNWKGERQNQSSVIQFGCPWL